MKFTNDYIQQLLIEKITGTINAVDDVIINNLLTEDAAVMHQWETIQLQMQQAEASGFSMEGDAEKSWQRIAPVITKPRQLSIFPWLKAVAAILVVIISGVYFFSKNKQVTTATTRYTGPATRSRITLSMDNGEIIYLKNTGSGTAKLGEATVTTNEAALSYRYPQRASMQWCTLSVPPVFDYKILLADGTEVWLNSETRLRFPFSFSGKTREVYLTGEAYFKVSKNASQPFIVHANEAAIRVLGTSFNVNNYDSGKVKTALVEGAVAAVANSHHIQLKPGFEAIYNAPQNGFQVAAFDESEVLSWMKGVYYFHNSPLKELAKILVRWYNIKVEFNNPALQNKTFSGEIVKAQPIEFFLDNIKISNQVTPDFKDGVLTFR